MTIHHTYASSCSYYDPGIFIERWVFERSSLYEGTAHCLFFFSIASPCLLSLN